MRWISVPLCFQNCCKINFAKGPNVNGKLTKWCRKNIPLTILTSMGPMLQELIRFSSSTSSFYFGVFCIVSSGWHNDKGTGVSGYCNASPISTWACKAWKKMLPKRSPVIVTVASFLSDTLVTLNLPVWVAELFIFCLLMGPENLPESWHSLQSTDLMLSFQSSLHLVKIWLDDEQLYQCQYWKDNFY